MNINPEKVKELVLIYSKLNEDYQEKLMMEAYKLQLEQNQLNLIQKEKHSFKKPEDQEKEVTRRTAERVEKIINMLDLFDKADDTEKATMFMFVNRLLRKGNAIQESDISITINQKDISMKEYLEQYLIDVDYEEAKEKMNEFMNYVSETAGEHK